MGTRAHWFRDSAYFWIEVDEDGPGGRRIYCDTITDAKKDAADRGADAMRVYRRGRWSDTLHGTYVRRGDRLVKL